MITRISSSADVLRAARLAACHHHEGFALNQDVRNQMRSWAQRGETDFPAADVMYTELCAAITSPSPSVFFTTLDDVLCLKPLFPMLFALKGQHQPPQHHPEVDTFVHQMMVLEQAVKMTDSPRVLIAALCHDLGKGLTPNSLLPHHHGHEAAGVPLVHEFCSQMNAPEDVTQLAALTCEFHTHIHRAAVLITRSFLKLLDRFNIFEDKGALFLDFILACEADARGRLGLENRAYPQADIARKVLNAALNVSLDSEVMASIPKEKQEAYVRSEIASRINRVLRHARDPKLYQQYREKYARFDLLSAAEKFLVLRHDSAHIHTNYVEQAIALHVMSDETKCLIKSCADAVKKTYQSLKRTESRVEIRDKCILAIEQVCLQSLSG